jgi:hypothetical protein
LTADGVGEANPLMRPLLAWGPRPFLLVKMLLTMAGVRFLVRARGRDLFGTGLRAGHLLLALTAIYTLVVGYEYLLWNWLAT